MTSCKVAGRALPLHFGICEEASRIENLRSSVFKEQHRTRPEKGKFSVLCSDGVWIASLS
jgi:hypothetical protein